MLGSRWDESLYGIVSFGSTCALCNGGKKDGITPVPPFVGGTKRNGMYCLCNKMKMQVSVLSSDGLSTSTGAFPGTELTSTWTAVPVTTYKIMCQGPVYSTYDVQTNHVIVSSTLI